MDAQKPKVRRVIQSEPTEPVDVLAVAGPAVAKRAVPALIGAALVALVLVIILRRSR
jgi:hypothetical protein